MRVEIICSEVFNIPVSAIQDATILNEIESWDSLAHMILITRLEDDFQIQFTGDQIADIKSISDIKEELRIAGASL
jgi:acyl carrier protein